MCANGLCDCVCEGLGAIPSLRRQPVVAHHKRKRPKHRRAGCLLCKPSKLTANKKADRARDRREWQRLELGYRAGRP